MSDPRSENQQIFMYIDESYGDNFCGICVVLVQGKENHDLLTDQIRKMSIDPSVVSYNTSGKFHYVENDISARQSLVPWISRMPISAYIAVTQVDIPLAKQSKDNIAYNLLLPNLLKPLRLKFKNRISENVDILINFENLSNKMGNDLIFFQSVLEKINGYENVYPIIATKENEPFIFIPDYFLGYIRDHLVRDPKRTWPVNSLKLMAGKIGLILKMEDKKLIHYGRGNEVLEFLS